MTIRRGNLTIASSGGWYWRDAIRRSYWTTKRFPRAESIRLPQLMYAYNTCQTLSNYTTSTRNKTQPSNASSVTSSSKKPLLSPPKGLEQPISMPFTRLDEGTWLHNRPETDVYKILIDAYRLRVEDMYVFRGELMEDSLYANQKSGLRGFKMFLRKAGTIPGLLPPWWNEEKSAACVSLGMDTSEWPSLKYAVKKRDIIEHYGDDLFPMQLRMLADEMYGFHPSGHDVVRARKFMVSAEREPRKPFHVFDMSWFWKILRP